ncbi:MAG: ABC transporter permease [Anaerolineae bacterium]|nr:ABC transporter permease [Anaerolineae bacterium]NUQ04552.1 ABC transporter permease [Anaerolineae bacterium]
MNTTVAAERSRSQPLRLAALLKGERLTTLNLFATFILICLIFASQSDFFLTLDNFLNVGRTLGVVGIVSIGMTMVLISGGVDLSVGSVAALSGVVTSILWLQADVPLGLATVIGLGACVLVGFINGFFVAVMRINPLITTLASFSIVRGLAFVLSSGQTNQLSNPAFQFLGRGDVVGIPASLLLMIALFAAAFVVMHFTQFGRNLYAIGGSAEASRLAGIAVRRHLLIVYTLSGLLSGLAGIVIASQLASSAPRAAVGLEFTVIAAVVLGGTSLSGGKGTLIGTLVGVFILRVLDNGLVQTRVSSFYQDVVSGSVLLLAVGFDQIRQKLAAAVKDRS